MASVEESALPGENLVLSAFYIGLLSTSVMQPELFAVVILSIALRCCSYGICRAFKDKDTS